MISPAQNGIFTIKSLTLILIQAANLSITQVASLLCVFTCTTQAHMHTEKHTQKYINVTNCPLWLGIGWNSQFLKSCILNLGVFKPFQGRHKLQMLFAIAVMIIHAQQLCTGGVRAVGSETDGSLS